MKCSTIRTFGLLLHDRVCITVQEAWLINNILATELSFMCDNKMPSGTNKQKKCIRRWPETNLRYFYIAGINGVLEVKVDARVASRICMKTIPLFLITFTRGFFCAGCFSHGPTKKEVCLYCISQKKNMWKEKGNIQSKPLLFLADNEVARWK
jgi:hypothetical protein